MAYTRCPFIRICGGGMARIDRGRSKSALQPDCSFRTAPCLRKRQGRGVTRPPGQRSAAARMPILRSRPTGRRAKHRRPEPAIGLSGRFAALTAGCIHRLGAPCRRCCERLASAAGFVRRMQRPALWRRILSVYSKAAREILRPWNMRRYNGSTPRAGPMP